MNQSRDDGDSRGVQTSRRWRAAAPSLPIATWLPHYRRPWLRPDLVAAAAVWAVLVPEGMAYASLAGLPPRAGLYAALAPLVAYALLGTCRQLTVGPSSAIAAFSAAAVGPLAAGDEARFIALSALLALLVGGILLGAGVTRLGFVSEFFARPVLTGFVAGLALVIGVGQANKLLGVEGGGTTFFGKLEHLLGELGSTSLLTLVVGAGALAVIFGLRGYAPRVPSALVAVAAGIVAVAVFGLDERGVHIVGEIAGGLPAPKIPSFGISDVRQLAPDAVALALVAFAESVAGARALAAKHGYEVDADQELVALGVANLGTGLSQGFAVDASLSRSAVADDGGAKTQMFGLVLLGFLVVTMMVLLPLFHDLPEAVLGAIVIAAVAHLVDVKELSRLRHVDTTDFALALICFAGVLAFGILVGLMIAVVVSLLAVVYRAYRPTAAILGRVPGVEGDEALVYRSTDRHPEYVTVPGLVILRVEGELFFANAGWFRETVRSLVRGQTPPVREMLVQASGISHVDTTASAMLAELVGELQDQGVRLCFARATTRLREDLTRNGITALVGADAFFVSVHAGVDDFARRSPDIPAGAPEDGWGSA